MDKKLLKSLLHLPADIAARERRIERLRTLLDELPDEVQETVQSSTDAGEATVICHATVRGRPVNTPERRELRELIRQQEQANALYREQMPEVTKWIEAMPDAELRVIISVKYCEDGTWADCAKALGDGTTPEACRMKLYNYLKRK